MTAHTITESEIYACGDVEVDCDARVVRVADVRHELTYGEFEVLLRLVRDRGAVLTREQLNPYVRSRRHASARAVDTYIARLRRKLHAAERFTIETVQNVGYRCHGGPSSLAMLGASEPLQDSAGRYAANV